MNIYLFIYARQIYCLARSSHSNRLWKQENARKWGGAKKCSRRRVLEQVTLVFRALWEHIVCVIFLRSAAAAWRRWKKWLPVGESAERDARSNATTALSACIVLCVCNGLIAPERTKPAVRWLLLHTRFVSFVCERIREAERSAVHFIFI